jgi:hypothetical protein
MADLIGPFWCPGGVTDLAGSSSRFHGIRCRPASHLRAGSSAQVLEPAGLHDELHESPTRQRFDLHSDQGVTGDQDAVLRSRRT